MKKFLLTLLLVVTAIGSALAASPATYTFNSGTNQESFDGKTTVVDEVITLSYSKGTGGTVPAWYSNGTSLRLYGGNSMTVTAAEGFKITKISMSTDTGSAKSATWGVTVDGGAATSYPTATTDWTIENGSSVVFKNNLSTGHFKIKSITVTYIPFVNDGFKAPVMSNEEEVVTLVNKEADSQMFYSINDADAQTIEYTAPFSVNASGDVVYVKIVKGDKQQVFEFPVTWVKTKYASIAEFLAEKPAKVTFTCPLTVIAQNYNSLFVTDGTANLLVYGTVPTYNAGDVIPAGAKGEYKLYNYTPELNNPTDFAEATPGTPAEPTLTTLAALTKDNVSAYVKISDALLTAEKITDPSLADGIKVYDKFSLGLTGEGDATGILAVNSLGELEFYPLTIIGTPKPVVATPAADENGVITVLRGTEITFSSRLASALKVEEVVGETTKKETVEGFTYTYVANAPAIISITPVNSEGVAVEALTALYEVKLEVAPLCEVPSFSVPSGKVMPGTKVTVSATNAAKIAYTVNGGELVTVDAVNNAIELTVAEPCTIEAYGINVDGVAGEKASVEYDVYKIYAFDFVNNTYGMTRLSGSTGSYNESTYGVDGFYTFYHGENNAGVKVTTYSESKKGTRLWKDGLRIYPGLDNISFELPDGYMITEINGLKNAVKEDSVGVATWTAANRQLSRVQFKGNVSSSNIAVSDLTVAYEVHNVVRPDAPASMIDFTAVPELSVVEGTLKGELPAATVEYAISVPEGHVARYINIPDNANALPAWTDYTDVKDGKIILGPGVGTLYITTHDGLQHGNPIVMPYELDAVGTGIINIAADGSAAVYYNLQGQRVASPEAGKLYIRVINGTATKVVK